MGSFFYLYICHNKEIETMKTVTKNTKRIVQKRVRVMEDQCIIKEYPYHKNDCLIRNGKIVWI